MQNSYTCDQTSLEYKDWGIIQVSCKPWSSRSETRLECFFSLFWSVGFCYILFKWNCEFNYMYYDTYHSQIYKSISGLWLARISGGVVVPAIKWAPGRSQLVFQVWSAFEQKVSYTKDGIRCCAAGYNDLDLHCSIHLQLFRMFYNVTFLPHRAHFILLTQPHQLRLAFVHTQSLNNQVKFLFLILSLLLNLTLSDLTLISIVFMSIGSLITW